MQIIVSKLATNYIVQGKGKTIVLLHGWGDSLHTFDQLAQKLSKQYEIIRLDLPGFGKTEAPPVAWSLDDYAQFVATFLQKLEVRPYAIIGHSNGGAIIMRGAGTDVLSANRYVLLASSGIRDEYKGRKKFIRLVAKAAKVLTMWLPGSFQKKLKRWAYKNIGSDMFVAEHLQETFKNIVSDDVRQQAENIQEPVELIYGRNDIATPVSHGKIFESLLQHRQLKVVEDAGHFVHHDQPEKVLAIIEEFLAS